MKAILIMSYAVKPPPGSAGPHPAPGAPIAADRRWWIFGTIAVGILLGSFTNSSLNAVLPVIRDDLEAPMAGVQ
ncbi:MAG TPA: hypothetical protein VHL09_05155, partial [Dehalococcoidia bacterium]|nr:hypothetical protein [Dehalococcoidia bacterium]